MEDKPLAYRDCPRQASVPEGETLLAEIRRGFLPAFAGYGAILAVTAALMPPAIPGLAVWLTVIAGIISLTGMLFMHNACGTLIERRLIGMTGAP